MTKAEASDRLDQIDSDPLHSIAPDQVADAKRLIEILPARALRPMPREWIRPEPIQRDQIEFFWSRTADIMKPGNRITKLDTMGSGRFQVLTGEPNAVRWQRSPDGYIMPNILALDADGYEALILQLIDWQIS